MLSDGQISGHGTYKELMESNEDFIKFVSSYFESKEHSDECKNETAEKQTSEQCLFK